MKKTWEHKKLGEVITLEYGKPLLPDQRKSDGKYPVYGANGIKDRTDGYFYDKPSIIIGRKGSAGEINLTEEKFWPLDVTYYVVYDQKKYDRKFLFYLLRNLQLQKLAKGVKPGINRNDVYAIKVDIPPLPEQQRIVDILDQSFAAIDQAIENIYVNIKYVQESYSNYLKQTLKYPIQNWRHSTIGEVCEIRSGTTLDPKTEKPHGEFPYLKVADLNLPENLKIITTSSRFINKSDINLKNLIPKGSIVFPKRGGAIFTNKKRITAKEIWMDLNLMAVTPKDEIIPLFLYYFFQNLDFRSFNKGSSVPQLNNYDILPLIIFFPKDKYEQEKIVNKLELYENYSKNLELLYEKKISLLQELKQSILNKAFNGDLS